MYKEIIVLAYNLIVIRVVLAPIYTYLRDPKGLKRFPGVSVAPITDLWGVLQQYLRTRTLAVHKAHRKYGSIVRVGPTNISFSTPEAIRDIYGHGTPALKDDFYQTFNSSHLNVSDAQERDVHSIKRKRFAIAFSQKRIVELEPVVQDHLQRVFHILDFANGKEVDMKQIMMNLMYNLIFIHHLLSSTLHISTSLGWAPRIRSLLKHLTCWHSGWKHGTQLQHITTHFVRERVNMDIERRPLCLELGELVTEAQNLFSAAGGNTEIALTSIIWYLASNPHIVRRLRAELADALLPQTDPSAPISYDLVKNLPYLRACIDEGLRLRPSIRGGLPRVVPKGGMMVSGEWLDEGTTVSVSTYTVHRDPDIVGADPERYIPERWLQPDARDMQRGFLAFSQGGRGCLGRNIAYFQMQLVIAALVWRYDFALREEGWELEVTETFSAHTVSLPVVVTRRE
ncbi:cytochrome P450 [Aspergillus niger CBS 101883]|uniref:cytochrome P450 n=1 Tax=Aspergillus lacticoffeatus (strain CBS 101883) TaxID=1450533 RepID=UPI000D7F6B7B|nr:cytochrome P450 [Aspergillus niger CBS 101883]PYH61222.1 cytochrome P450 [Aspergillus niger CBS 101883]